MPSHTKAELEKLRKAKAGKKKAKKIPSKKRGK